MVEKERKMNFNLITWFCLFPLSNPNDLLWAKYSTKTTVMDNNSILLKVYSMDGKKQKLFEAKEKSDMFMRQVSSHHTGKEERRIFCLNPPKTPHTTKQPKLGIIRYDHAPGRSYPSSSQHTGKKELRITCLNEPKTYSNPPKTPQNNI